MSNMIVSLLLKVREEGADLIGKMHDGLQRLAHDDSRGDDLGKALADGLHRSVAQTRELVGRFHEARKAGGELFETIVHGTLGISAASYAFKKGFLDIALEAEEIRTRLQAIEGTPGRAEAAFSWLKDFSSQTTSSLADVTQAWISLREHGVRPTESTMKALADASVATGFNIGDIARTFGNVVSDHFIGRLRDLGVNVIDQGSRMAVEYRYLGKVITESFSKFNKEALAGGLTRIMGLLHDGAAKRASEGLAGSLMKLGSAWHEFALEVMEKGGVIDHLTEKIREFTAGGKEMAEGQKSNAQVLAETFKDIIDNVFEIAKTIRENLPWVIEQVKQFVGAVGGIKVVVGAVVALLAAPFVAALVTLGGTVATTVTTAIVILNGVLFEIGMVVLNTVIPAVIALGTALLATPVGWIIMCIAALIVAAYELYEHWDTVKAALGEAWEWLKGVWASVWDTITGRVAEDVAAVIAGWEKVKAFFAGLWNFIKSGWDNSIGLITSGIDKVKGLLPSFGSVPSAAAASGAALAGGVAGGAKVDGRIAVDVTIDGEGRARARVSSTSSGPLDIDPNLGIGMAFAP